MTRLPCSLALLALAAPAHAQRITYHFTGEVTQINDLLPGRWAGTVVGDPVEVVCDVNPLADPIMFDDFPSMLAYGDSVRELSLAVGSEEITTFAAAPTVLTMQNDDTLTPECADSFFINATVPGELALIVFLEAQSTPCPDVFPGLSVPTQLDLDDFATRYVFVSIGGANLRATVDSITVATSLADNELLPSCFGDGGVAAGCTPCPCGNDAASGSLGGCLNGFGTGAQLVGIGSHSVLAGDGADLRFGLEGAAPGSFAVLVSGSGVAPLSPAHPCFGSPAGVSSPVLDGLRCAAQSVVRHGTRATNGGGAVPLMTNGWSGAPDVTAGLATGGGFGAGQSRSFQAFYRTPPFSGCGTGQNTSQALSMTFTP